MKSHSRRFAPLFPGALLASCSDRPAPTAADHLHERITRLDTAPDGSATVAFESSQRVFRIDPKLSPDAPAMLAFATSAKAAGRTVHATVAPSGDRKKGDDGPPFVLVRLADSPPAGR